VWICALCFHLQARRFVSTAFFPGRGLFYFHFPTVADLSVNEPFSMTYCPYEMAKQIDCDECVTLMDMYNPMDQVVLIVACVVSPSTGATVFKGRIISSDSNQLIPDVVDTNGQVLKGRIWRFPEDAKIRQVLNAPHCNFCGEVDKLENRLLLCGQCKVFRYCSKECQASDWQDHKDICHYTKELQEDAVKYIDSIAKR
jgi:MYND finger